MLHGTTVHKVTWGLHKATHGIGLHWVIYGYTGLYMATQGYICMATQGYIRLKKVYIRLQKVYMGLHRVTWATQGYIWLHRVTLDYERWGYKGLHGATQGCMGLHRITWGYTGLRKATQGYIEIYIVTWG